ncbi:DUF421 domain-containing protein [Lignipirellula cremea]|uniref:YetF C-terminal domain-containing protein n=1 Tax=Lignipirellula cremea TaxID=2528010 RepID=A0A518DYL1_9BACT|nr:YetF domain-containing protein [Lignipirellula cremea]QDU96927.1 hypothetical protein Pla8534_47500 [Lignipirellula cremea]
MAGSAIPCFGLLELSPAGLSPQPESTMMNEFTKWFAIPVDHLITIFISACVTYIAILVFTRMTGLRSFSKMSASDFAMTVAVGSLFASTISSASPPLLAGLFSLGLLFAGQALIASLRRRFGWFGKLVDNQPILLMVGRQMFHENLHRTNVTEADIYAKLREANALNYDEVRAVIFETTGDISVLHSAGPAELEPDFLKDVVDHQRLQAPAQV